MQSLSGLSELTIRLAVFLSLLVVMGGLEFMRPRRALSQSRVQRWKTNFAIVALASLLVRVMAALPRLTGGLVMPLAAVATAVWAERQGVGALHWLALPWAASFALSLLILDFAVWLQHLASHKIDFLWQVHKVHHADRDLDISSAIRFHPFEIAFSMLYKMVWVAALGAPPEAVLAFEVILNGCAIFNHANVALPARLDRFLRLALVTPDMHRVHHSIDRAEHDSNYGFNLSIWDRLFRTYVAEPSGGQTGMTLGLAPHQTDAPSRLGWSLALPFRRAE